MDYYHRSRTHLGLEKDTPVPRPIQSADMGQIFTLPEVGIDPNGSALGRSSRISDVSENDNFPQTVMATDAYTIGADIPDTLEPSKRDNRVLGKMLTFFIKGHAEMHFGKQASDGLMRKLGDGNHSFIFDDNGRFLVNPPPLDDEVVRSVRFRHKSY